MIVGLALLTAGIFFGAVWANESWGRYWGWDPKETWALITMFAYALATHSRHIPRLDGPVRVRRAVGRLFLDRADDIFRRKLLLVRTALLRTQRRRFADRSADRGLRRHSADRGGGRPIFQNLEKKMIPA